MKIPGFQYCHMEKIKETNISKIRPLFGPFWENPDKIRPQVCRPLTFLFSPFRVLRPKNRPVGNTGEKQANVTHWYMEVANLSSARSNLNPQRAKRRILFRWFLKSDDYNPLVSHYPLSLAHAMFLLVCKMTYFGKRNKKLFQKKFYVIKYPIPLPPQFLS